MRFVRMSQAGLLIVTLFTVGQMARAEGDPHKVKHVIVIMQENHSFDNYFGALTYAPGSPYHAPKREDRDERDGGCRKDDHRCVDGLACSVDAAGKFTCRNANLDDDGSTVFAFHDSRRCVAPDLDHGWANTHRSANFNRPNDTLFQG